MLNARKTLISIAMATTFCSVAQADLLGGGVTSSAASTITGSFGGAAPGPVGGALGGGFGTASEAGAHGRLGSSPATDIAGAAQSRTRAVMGGTARAGRRQAESASNVAAAARESAGSEVGTVRDQATDEANAERSASIAGMSEGSAAASSGPISGVGGYETGTEAEATASRQNGVRARGYANAEASASAQR